MPSVKGSHDGSRCVRQCVAVRPWSVEGRRRKSRLGGLIFSRACGARTFTLYAGKCASHTFTLLWPPQTFTKPPPYASTLSRDSATAQHGLAPRAPRRRGAGTVHSARLRCRMLMSHRQRAPARRDSGTIRSHTVQRTQLPGRTSKTKEPARGSSRGSTAAALACLQASSAVLNPRDDSPVALLRDAHKIGLIGATTVRTLALWRRAAGAALVRVGG